MERSDATSRLTIRLPSARFAKATIITTWQRSPTLSTPRDSEAPSGLEAEAISPGGQKEASRWDGMKILRWRRAWTEYFGAQGFPYHPRHDIYVNFGFIGLAKGHIDFLRLWKRLQELLAPALGDLQSRPSLDGKSPFCFPDQCAFNIALESTPHPMSLLGKEGMGFRPHRATRMMHAAGYPKPWHMR